MGPLVLASQVATGLAGAMLVKFALDNHDSMAGGGSRWQRCATCNGTGRVSCMCTRWSDGDVGCRTCAGSGRRACSNCGGTGTGRPLPVQLHVRSRPPPK